MGGGASTILSINCGNKIAAESIANAEEVALTNRLNSIDGMLDLRKFSKTCGKSYLLNIWDLILECDSGRAGQGELTALGLSLIQHENMFPMSMKFVAVCEKSSTVTQTKLLFSQIKACCFRHIFTQIYEPYTESSCCSNKRLLEKIVSVDSFEYLNVIAKGGFGLVAQVRMKSTNSLYAMKIQPKKALLKHFYKDKSRVTNELAGSVVFDHPYLANIAYAFHTETLTMLVSEISSCGDLSRSLKLCPDNRMSADRVVFYAAEIISALMYLHRHDIMYRDLKPANVLLFGDGHIKLADFGAFSGKFCI